MKKLIVLAMVIGILVSGCGAGGHGCLSIANNWYAPDSSVWKTSKDLVACRGHEGVWCSNGQVLEGCMQQKGYAWVDMGMRPIGSYHGNWVLVDGKWVPKNNAE